MSVYKLQLYGTTQCGGEVTNCSCTALVLFAVTFKSFEAFYMPFQVSVKFYVHMLLQSQNVVLQRPSTLEGFTLPISNDRGHILPGIPRSQNSPWGEFVGTWDLSKPSLKPKFTRPVKDQSIANPEQEILNTARSRDGTEKQRTVSPLPKEQSRMKECLTPEANIDTTEKPVVVFQ